MGRSDGISPDPRAGLVRDPADATRQPFALSERDRARLGSRLALAVRRARRSGGEVLATITVRVSDELDPAAVVCASRRPGEHWFVFEQPDRAHAVVAGLGAATSIHASGAMRFQSVAERWRALAAAAVADPAEEPAGRWSGCGRRLRLRPRRRPRPALAGIRARVADRPAADADAPPAPRRADRAPHPGHARAPRRCPRGASGAAAAAALGAARRARCRCWTRRRPAASRYRARCRPSTTSRPSRAPPS